MLAAESWKELGETERFHALAELALALDPARAQDRFTLAYAYGETHTEALSFVHYRAVVQIDESNDAAWNNLGVAANAVKLPVNAYRAFERARALNNALAAGNLAHVLIDIGRLNEAAALCEQTIAAMGTDERITSAQARIQSMPREEAARIEEMRQETRPIREFYQSWGRAYFSPPPAVSVRVLELAVSEDSQLTVECEFVEGFAVGFFPGCVVLERRWFYASKIRRVIIRIERRLIWCLNAESQYEVGG